MEQTSGSIVTLIGTRAFSAHLLPLTSLLWPSTAFGSSSTFRRMNTGVSYFLDYVGDIYDG